MAWIGLKILFIFQLTILRERTFKESFDLNKEEEEDEDQFKNHREIG